MSESAKPNQHETNGHDSHYVFRLFMAGNGQNSRKALSNLHSLCHQHLEGRYTIKTVDVVDDFQAAIDDNILVTPALILVAPLPKVMVLGNLSDLPTVLAALRLSEDAS